jgi:hypothetical protein
MRKASLFLLTLYLRVTLSLSLFLMTYRDRKQLLWCRNRPNQKENAIVIS